MKRIIMFVLAILILAFAAFVLSRIPFPDSKARDAVGQKVYNPTHYGNVEFNLSPSHQNWEIVTQPILVILIPSAGRETSDFNSLVNALNDKGYPSITVEAPGINGSSLNSDEPIDYSSLSRFISRSHSGAKTGIEKAVVVGHAFGNRIARTFAFENSDLVGGVILLAAGGENKIDPVANKALENVFNPLASFKQRKKDISYAFFAEGNEIPDHWLRGWHTKTAILQGKAKDHPIEGDWQGAGGVPILVVQPAQDRIAPKEDTADVLLARYPDQVEVVVIENAGHALLPEQPEAVANAVIEFLDRMSGE